MLSNRPEASIHQLFEEQVERSPDAVAVVFEGEQLTYRQLNAKANQLAHYLQSLGVGPEVLVGICVERSLEMVIGLLGILKAGGAYVPLDPAYPQERLAFMLEDSSVSVLLTQAQLVKKLPQQSSHIVCLDFELEKIAFYSQENAHSPVTPNNLAYVIYTSGSTGRPKGAMNTHQGICNRLLWMQNAYQLTSADSILQKTPFSFDVSVWEFFWPLLVGARLVMARPEGHKDTTYLVKAIAQYQITTLHFVPSMLQLFLEAQGLNACTCLRQVMCSGEALPFELQERFFTCLPQVKLHNLYGPTEAAVDVTFWECKSDYQRSIVPIGRPIANIQIYILDRDLQSVPIGVSGELHIAGVGLARGYFRRPDLTAEKFIPNPYSDTPGERLYKTGDLARYLPDGNIEYIGRIDQQIKIRGFRIELGEIEAVLCQHPDVRSAVVMAREDVPGNKRLVAYIISNFIPDRVPFKSECLAEFAGEPPASLHISDLSKGGVCLVGVPDECYPGQSVRLRVDLPGGADKQWLSGRVAWCKRQQAGIEFALTPTERDRVQQSVDYLIETQGFLKVLQRTDAGNLRRFLQQKLPEYMVPSSFVFLKALPLTPNGKADRKALPAPEKLRATRENFVAPNTPIEEILAEIWGEVLGVEKVGVHDNFMELGGQSLLAAQVISRLRDKCQVEVPMRSLLEASTIASLAQYLETSSDRDRTELAPAIESISRSENLPLSFSQRQVWFLCQLHPDMPVYNEPVTVRFAGAISVAALEQSLNELIRRHEVLRTNFLVVNGEPVQVVRSAYDFKLPVVDLRKFPGDALENSASGTRTEEALLLATEEARQPFDLNCGPLLRATLMQLDDADYRLFLTLHHLIVDGVSFYNVFLKELELLYVAFYSGKPSPLPELPIQYADFTWWQRQWLQDNEASIGGSSSRTRMSVLAPQMAYWKQQLANLPVLQLPTDHPRPAVQSFRGARQCLALSKSLTDALKVLSQQEEVTLFTTLLAAFKTLLHRYAGQDDIVVGTTTDDRSRPELEGLIGFFLNTLVLRTDMSGNPSFRQLLERVREVTLGAYAHKDLPFEKLVAELQPERNLSQNPLFQVAFIFEPPIAALDLHWAFSQLDIHTATSKFDLTFELDERPEGIIGRVEYSTDLFEAATIARMIEHFQALLESIVADPEQRLSELLLLTNSEKEQLKAWNQTQAILPTGCMHELFEAQAEQTPDAVAAIFEGEQLTYRELNRLANQLAHYLRSLGVGPEVLVGICVERSLEMVVGLFGILKAGAAYVPLDPAYPPERLAYMLEHAQAKVLLTQAHLVNSLPEHQARVFCLDADWVDVATNSDVNPTSNSTPDNLAYIIYTSGSTGKPKGVAIEHRSAVNTLLDINQRFGVGVGDRVLALSSLSFDLSVYDIFGLLAAGGTLVIPKPSATPDPAHWADTIAQEQVTVWNSAPALMQLLANTASDRGLGLPSSMRLVLMSGDWIPMSLLEQIKTLVPSAAVISLGGATEASIWSILYPIETIDPTWNSIPYGRAMTNQSFHILDEELAPCATEAIGQLYIGGIGLARGYWRNEEKTRASFIHHPHTGERLYRTGDLGRYMPDGNIEFLGRIDNQVKIRGFRVEIGEIEAVLCQHPDVRSAVAIAREDVPGNKRLVAYIVSKFTPDHRVPLKSECLAEFAGGTPASLHISDLSTGGVCLVGVPDDCYPGQSVRLRADLPGGADQQWLSGRVVWRKRKRAGIQFVLTPAESELVQQSIDYLLETRGFLKVLHRTDAGNLRRFLKQKLPEYMVPSSFVFLKALPLTPNGKVDRKALPAPETLRDTRENFVAPNTPIEEILAEIWAEVLGVEKVGVRDNFMELGGHSLLAAQVISRLRNQCQVEVSMRSLLEASTIASLAQQLETSGDRDRTQLAAAIEPISRSENLPLSSSQRQLWFLSQLHPNIPVYNEPVTVRFAGSISVAALEQSLNEIIRRHEILRTHFSVVNGEPLQVVRPAYAFKLPVVDLRRFPHDALENSSARTRTAKAWELAAHEAKKPFNLGCGPLWRATLMQLDDTDYRLFLTLHHLIIDAVSLYSVLLKELEALYVAFCNEKPSPLPELPIQYADFAWWQQQQLQNEASLSILATQTAYWKQQLADLPVLQLPADRPRPVAQSFRGAKQYLALSKSLTDALKALSQQEEVTLFTTLLAAFKTLLHCYAGQDDIVVGTVTADRNRAEIEELIGFFLNTLVLRTDMSGNPSFRQLLGRVREVTLGAYAHKDLPFERLVAELQPERNLSQNPLFQVAFVLEPPMAAFDLGWTLSQLDIHTDTSKFDLTLALDERAEGIIGRVEYSTDLFEAATIARMVEHFQALLESIVADPEQRLSELLPLTDSQEEQLEAWNQTQTAFPGGCIHELFEAQTEQTPDAVAIVFEEEQLTYGELNAKANQLAYYLQQLGVGPEVLVGICVERSLEMVVGLLGILKAGAAYVPLDPAYPQERLTFMLEDTQIPVLLTQRRLEASLPKHKARVVCLDAEWEAKSPPIDIGSRTADYSQENPSSGVTSSNLAYVMYTSGSTGKPKGVSVIHQGVVRLVKETNYVNLSDRDVFLQLAPISFDASTFEIWGCLLNGGKLAIASAHTPSLQELGHALRKYQVTTLWLTAGLFHLMVDEHLDDLKNVRQLLAGGDVLSVPQVQKALQALKGGQLINGYGPTENTTFTCCHTVTQTDRLGNSVPIGCSISNTQVYLLDAYLQQVPIGVPGEVYIGGAGLARDYFHRPDLTAEKFIPNPYSDTPGERLYKTGDLARYLADGNIEYIGRIDRQVKIRGFRIELGEIESALRQHPDVREAVVMAREDVPGDKRLVAYMVSHFIPDRVPFASECWVEFDSNCAETLHATSLLGSATGTPLKVRTEDISTGGISVVGVPDDCWVGKSVRVQLRSPLSEDEWLDGHVVWCQDRRAGIEFAIAPKTQVLVGKIVNRILETQGFLKMWQRTSLGKIRSFLKETLPEYMMPSSFVFLNSFPLTPNGKVDRKALPAPEKRGLELESTYASPQTELEQSIATIWQEVLQIEKVGLYDNFFDLGGHSLRMAQLHAKLREVLQINVSMVELFKYPTIHSFSSYLSQNRTQESPDQQGRDRAKAQTELVAPINALSDRALKQKEAMNRQKQRMQAKRNNHE